MSQDQYNPYGASSYSSDTQAASKVSLPAIGLIVVASLAILAYLVAILLNLLGVGLGASAGGSEGMAGMLQGGLGVVMYLVFIVMAIVILLGAFKMKSVSSYGFALTSAILAALPCWGPCCCLGLPIGIWAIVVLMDQNVKAAFQA